MQYVGGKLHVRKAVHEVEKFMNAFWPEKVKAKGEYWKPRTGFSISANEYVYSMRPVQYESNSDKFIHDVLDFFADTYNKKFIYGFNKQAEMHYWPKSNYVLAPWEYLKPFARKHDDELLLRVDKYSTDPDFVTQSTYFHYEEIKYPVTSASQCFGVSFSGYELDVGTFIRGTMRCVSQENVTRQSFAKDGSKHFHPHESFNVKDHIKANRMHDMLHANQKIMEHIRLNKLPMVKQTEFNTLEPDWNATTEYLEKFSMN